MAKRARRMYNTHEDEEDHKGYAFLHGRPLQPDWWHQADRHQLHYDASIDFARVVMVDAEAGTGKTTIAVKKGLEYLSKGKVDRIVYVRFVDSRAMKLGALPGTEGEKGKGFMLPFFEAMMECGFTPDEVAQMMELGLLEATTDIHWRGRNMKRVFLIIDECQNGDIEDIKLIFTRLHDAGKGIAIGHSGQVDRKLPRYGSDKLIPFQVYQMHMAKKSWTKLVDLHKNYRGEVSQWADKVQVTINELIHLRTSEDNELH